MIANGDGDQIEPLFLLANGDWWCMRCGRCLEVDNTGRCRECSYMVKGRSPDRLDQALAEIEAAREAAADAGLDEVYAALVKAHAVLTYLDGELDAREVQ